MTLLRLYCPLLETPSQCEWVLLDDNGRSTTGKGPLGELPRRANRVQLIVPAPDVLIIRARLPDAARRAGASVLAFAVEEQTIGEQDAQHVSWLGTAAGDSVLAVLNKHALARWRDALERVGIRSFEIHSEMLLLPWTPGEWSVAWNGQEGFIRTGKLEAVATDSGDRESPALSLSLMLDQAKANGTPPRSLALYATSDEAMPDVEAWQTGLEMPIRVAGIWDWRRAAPGEGVGLAQEARRWNSLAGVLSKLRLAAWLTGIALALHAVALIADWTILASEQRNLRRDMDIRFRATFTDAVAVVDPVLQMRRKLAEARHMMGQPDVGDFLPMIEKVALEMKDLPIGTIRILSFEGGRMTLEVNAIDEQSLNRIVTRLRQSGMSAEKSSSSSAGRAVITVRAL